MVRILLATTAIWCSVGQVPKFNPDKVWLKRVSLAGLEKDLKTQRGKVVVVYVWDSLHVPASKGLADFVSLRNKFLPTDVACATLNIPYDDDREDYAVAEKVIRSQLAAKSAFMLNFYMTGIEIWQANQLDVVGVPSLLIYDRSGKIAVRWSAGQRPLDFGEAEKITRRLLRAK